MKKLLITGILLAIISLEISASEQYPDLLVYNGKEYEIDIYPSPIETYFKIHPDKRPETTETSSALDRGYRAKYEIINNELILIDIEIEIFDIDIEKRIFNTYYEYYKILEIENGNFIKEYDQDCYEYLQSLVQSSQNGSYEQNYYIKILEELKKIKK
jgi:hypothetical protein